MGAVDDRQASVIVDNVHVTYQTYGGKRRKASTDATDLAWSSLLGKLGKHVGAYEEVHAVRGVSFVAWHGQSIGLIGRNGSGKSTLLRAIAGLMPLAEGRVFAKGEVALLGVSAALVPQLTGARNVLLGGLAQGLTKREVKERFDEIAEFAGIGEFINLPMSSYSSGMGARLRFAIATATTPDVLVVDEALSTGDTEFRRKSAQRIDEIRAQAGTVFVVSHSPGAIREMCDRVIWLDKGVVVADGGIEVLEEYEARYDKKK